MKSLVAFSTFYAAYLRKHRSGIYCDSLISKLELEHINYMRSSLKTFGLLFGNTYAMHLHHKQYIDTFDRLTLEVKTAIPNP